MVAEAPESKPAPFLVSPDARIALSLSLPVRGQSRRILSAVEVGTNKERASAPGS